MMEQADRGDEPDIRVEDLRGLRPTRQRKAVLGAVERLGAFSSAQGVYEELVRIGETVGLSTVYRSLHALAGRGAVDTRRSSDGEMLYRRCDEAPHHHLVCRRCGQTTEIPGEALRRLADRGARSAGFVDTEVVLEVFGTCRPCAAPNKQ